MMKKIFSLLLLCAVLVFASCGNDDDGDTTIAVAGVSVTPATLSLKIGKTATLTATVAPENATVKEVKWSSSNITIATVNAATGEVTAVAVGETIITATTVDGGKAATCTVTVTPVVIAVTSITLDGDKKILVGAKVTPVATILPADATVKTLTWSSSNTAVATVNAATGEVTAVAKGETTITATSTSNTTVTATCKVTVEEKPNFVEVNGIKVAVGNLVADGANNVKIGTATDGGLFFQFGSLVGWSATDPLAVAVKPAGYTGSTTWNKDWTGDPATENVATGTGDPCKYYLKGTWRLPTKDEYKALFNNVTDGSYANSGGWSWDATSKSATNNTKNLTFPASGCRYYSVGSLYTVGANGYYWSASPSDASYGYYLSFTSSIVNSSNYFYRAGGLPVRCVQNASN